MTDEVTKCHEVPRSAGTASDEVPHNPLGNKYITYGLAPRQNVVIFA